PAAAAPPGRPRRRALVLDREGPSGRARVGPPADAMAAVDARLRRQIGRRVGRSDAARAQPRLPHPRARPRGRDRGPPTHQAGRMKLAIISDVHANLEALTAVLADIETRSVDRIVCLGDIVGYNADPDECLALLRRHAVLCVAGNHDRAVAGQLGTEGFPHTAARAVRWTRHRLGAL